MAWIAGVDGCPGGWIVVYADIQLKNLECCVKKDFKDVMEQPGLAAVAVDMPIGLWDKGKRDCDAAARRVLGKRHVSVFSAPAAGVVDLYRKMTPEERSDRNAAYNRAKDLNEKLTGKRLTQQTWNLVPKIAGVDDYVRSPLGALQRVYEVHPEVSFAAMKAKGGVIDPGHHPMKHSKTKPAGRNERCEFLQGIFGEHVKDLKAKRLQLRKLANRRAAVDDLYDALVCLWTAYRIGKGKARALCGVHDVRKLSDAAPEDANGLPMRIVY